LASLRLWFGHNLADCATHAADDCVDQIRGQHTNGTASQEVSIDGRDLLAEDDAVVAQTTTTSRQSHSRRSELPPREDRDDN